MYVITIYKNIQFWLLTYKKGLLLLFFYYYYFKLTLIIYETLRAALKCGFINIVYDEKLAIVNFPWIKLFYFFKLFAKNLIY